MKNLERRAFPCIGVSFLLLLSLLLGLFAGCNASSAGTPSGPLPGASNPRPTSDTLTFTIAPFPDATVDITLNVVDSSTLATLFSQTAAAQVTPLSATCSFPPTPVNVSMSVKFNFNLTNAVRTGSNSTSGTVTVTDGLAFFTNPAYPRPLFVVDDPPTVVVNVLSIGSTTTLNLAAPFPSATYYLFESRQLSARIEHTYVGTDAQMALFTDNTLGTLQFNTSF